MSNWSQKQQASYTKLEPNKFGSSLDSKFFESVRPSSFTYLVWLHVLSASATHSELSSDLLEKKAMVFRSKVYPEDYA